MAATYGTLPFPEAIKYLQDKMLVPTERWTDLWRDAHDTGFAVAGAMKADLLADLKAAVVKARAEGTTLAQFRKDFDAIVKARGWTGWTGEGSQAGRAWRTWIIYDTNMRMSDSAGRWAQAQATKSTRPFLIYKHSHASTSPRQQHLHWDGLVLAQDDPWVQAHWPPNGWGCKCRFFTLSQADIEKRGLARPMQAPKITLRNWTDKATGEVHQVPKGIDPGFDYTPGASLAMTVAQRLIDKAAALPADIRAQLLVDLNAVKTRSQDKPDKVFEPQKTAKAAERYAVGNGLVDVADYTGIKAEVANAMNQSLFEHLTEFPALRGNQQFIGSAQRQFARWYESATTEYVRRLVGIGMSEDVAKEIAKQRLKKLKMPARHFAHSWLQEGVSGIAVNERWGRRPDEFRQALRRDVEEMFHPLGCDTFRSVIDHELGHQLDSLLELSQDSEINALFNEMRKQNTITQELSEYASNNIAEFIAEAWAEYRNNPTPRPVASRIGGIVRERYQSRFAAATA